MYFFFTRKKKKCRLDFFFALEKKARKSCNREWARLQWNSVLIATNAITPTSTLGSNH